MSAAQLTGLGEPQAIGKQALFQPPAPESEDERRPIQKEKAPQELKAKPENIRRVHVTIDMTLEALQVIQAIQHQHRMQTGKVLPLWKAVSQALVHYGKSKNKG